MKNFLRQYQVLLGLIVGAFVIGFFISMPSQEAESEAMDGVKSVDLFEAAARHPRGSLGIPAQWFMMESFLDEIGWEKMMLVFGYADNVEVCAHLVEMAKAESPSRNFRCADAN